MTSTEKYNAAFLAATKASRRIELAYRSMHGIKEARAAYESSRKKMNEARNEMDDALAEREKGGTA